MSADLEVCGLEYRHPGAARAAVRSVSLSVGEGQMLAVVGPSGSGKTTVLRLVAGLLTPQSGDVRLAGNSMLAVPPERRRMTMMFQKPLLFPHLDVLDNVAFADRVAGRPRAQAREAARRFLDLVHLGEVGARRPRELSGGQEQRVALARALAARPHVLLLDEPFSALDTALRTAMHGLLGEVRAALGPTIVMVTHDLAEAALADTVAVLIDGALARCGTLDELYRSPGSLEVARMLGGFSEIPGVLTAAGHDSVLGRVRVEGSERDRPPGTPAVLLLRQEAVEVVPAQDSRADATGVVAGLVRAGMRHVVHVDVAAGRTGARARVLAELPIGGRLDLGDQVGLVVRRPGVCVIAPGAHGSSGPWAGEAGPATDGSPRDPAQSAAHMPARALRSPGAP